MLVRALRDFAGRAGVVVHVGEVVAFDDDADAYNLVHAGLAEPPLRLCSAVDGLIGSHCVSVGQIVDVGFADEHWLSGRDPRVCRLAAVVTGGGELVAAPPALALQVVAAGGRYASQAEADSLDLGRPPAKPAPVAEGGPRTRLFFVDQVRLKDGRKLDHGEFADVATAEAQDLLDRGVAKPCVPVRVVKDDVLVGNRVCARGDVVGVPKSMAKDKDRFERLDGEDVDAKAASPPSEGAKTAGRPSRAGKKPERAESR